MDRRVLVVVVVVGVLALVGVGIALQPPSTEPSALKTLTPKARGPAESPPADDYTPPPAPSAPGTSGAEAAVAPAESQKARAIVQAAFEEAVGEAVKANHLDCALDQGIVTSHALDLPVAVKGGVVDADCSDASPDMRGLCGCLEGKVEATEDLAVYDGLSFVYHLEINMKD